MRTDGSEPRKMMTDPFPSTAIDRARFQIFCADGGAANGTSSRLWSAVWENPEVSDANAATIQHAYLFTEASDFLMLAGTILALCNSTEVKMTSRLMIGLCAILFLNMSCLGIAQSTGVQDGIKLGKVYVTGENPVIRLLDKEDGQILTNASYWRIVWSPAGPGHVAYVTTGDGKASGDLRMAFTDNRKLYDFLTREIMSVLDKTIPQRPFTVVEAKFDDQGQGTFSDSGDTMKERKVSLKSTQYKVDLVWRDFYSPFQLDTPVGGAQNPFGVTSLFIPAKSADVMINGKKMAGNVYPQKRGPAQSSSAFLAFSESWIK